MSIGFVVGHPLHRLLHVPDVHHLYDVLVIEDQSVLVISQDRVAGVLYWVSAHMGFCFPVVPYSDLLYLPSRCE